MKPAKKILFIEDEPALQKTLGDFLRAHGYTVIAALDGETGLELVRRERPEAVLLDLILPRMHGLEVLKAMRAEAGLAAIPTVVLTNVEDNASVEQAIELGARAYCVKTDYTLDEVLQKLEAVLAGA